LVLWLKRSEPRPSTRLHSQIACCFY